MKIDYMKKSSLLFLLISIFGFAQDKSKNQLEGLWRIDEIIGMYPSDEYNLYKPKEDEVRNSWLFPDEKVIEIGNGINFKSNGSFNSIYSAPCGNDCFPSSKGTFKLIDSTHIRVRLELVEIPDQSGFCPHIPTDSTRRDLGIFLIKKQENGYKLIKCSEKESDRQCEKYSEMANNLPIINKNDPSYKEVKLDIKTREKKDPEILKTGLKEISDFTIDKVELLYTTYPSIYDNEKRFVFKYNDNLWVAVFHSGSLQFILHNNNN